MRQRIVGAVFLSRGRSWSASLPFGVTLRGDGFML